jgi:hypothetical protein
MTGFFRGPPLLVHIVIIAVVNGFFFPFLYQWTGSILYAFLVSVALLCVYGVAAVWIVGRR